MSRHVYRATREDQVIEITYDYMPRPSEIVLVDVMPREHMEWARRWADDHVEDLCDRAMEERC